MARLIRSKAKTGPTPSKSFHPACSIEFGRCRMFCTYTIGRRKVCLGFPLENCPNDLVWLSVDGEEVGKIEVNDIGPWMAAFIRSLRYPEFKTAKKRITRGYF